MNCYNDIQHESYNINSKRLMREIDTIVRSYICDDSVCWDDDNWRTSLECVLDEHMGLLQQETNLLERWKVICNNRNNPSYRTSKNFYKLEISFQQINCLNTSQLIYNVHWYIISKDHKNQHDYGW